jgi:hypothetical protein
MSNIPPPLPDWQDLPSLPLDPSHEVPIPLPPDGPSIGPANPFPSNGPGGEIPDGPDEGGEPRDFPEIPEVEPAVDNSGSTGDTLVADRGSIGGRGRRRSSARRW